MRYSILGFNQELAVKEGLDLTDLLLLDYLYNACTSPSMIKICEDNQPYVWLKHDKILHDIPIINIKEDMLKKRIHKLIEMQFIKSVIKTDKSLGRRAYYTITTQCERLRFSPDSISDQGEKITLDTDDQGEKITLDSSEPRVINYPSDNKLNIDNKLNTISKDIVINHSKNNPNNSNNDINNISEYESKMYNDDVIKTRKISNADSTPKKKLNLWDKCVQSIDEYTDNQSLRDALVEYLKVRLAIKDKPIYHSQWKALLRKLGTLAGDPVKIVNQSTELGYASFYELRRNYANYNRPNLQVFGEHQGVNSVKVSNEERERMFKYGTIF